MRSRSGSKRENEHGSLRIRIHSPAIVEKPTAVTCKFVKGIFLVDKKDVKNAAAKVYSIKAIKN